MKTRLVRNRWRISSTITSWSLPMKTISWILILAMIHLSQSCMYYFRVRSIPNPPSQKLYEETLQKKTFVIHLEDKTWLLTEPDLTESALTGKSLHEYQKEFPRTIKKKGSTRYKPGRLYNENYILKEVHLYVTELEKQGAMVLIPLNAVQKIEIHEKDPNATAASWVAGFIGGTLAAYTIIVIIALLTKSSCPFIYVYDGEEFQFTGEIYSGSVQPGLERHDYLKLPVFRPEQITYQIKISNEMQEIQHTNLMELWVFDHPKNQRIWIDKYGNPHTVTTLTPPTHAFNLGGEDVTDFLNHKDNRFYASSEPKQDYGLTDCVILEFPNPQTSDTAKLVIKAKNSPVLDYMIGKFQNQFGDAWHKWDKKQRNASGVQLKNWMLNQNIPLSVYVERSGQWHKADYFEVAGPMIMKEDIRALALDGTESNPLKVKLEYGNYFWEIDFAGVDYSINLPVKKERVTISSAIDEKGRDVTKRLSRDDRKYYIQPNVGNNAIIAFKLPENSDECRTIYLHSKGWYQVLRNPTGKPDREYLESFREPGRFNQFVNEQIKLLNEINNN